MNIEERNERMQRVLTAEESSVMWVQGESNRQPSLHSTEGDHVATLPEYLVPIIDGATDSDAASICEAIADCCAYASGQGFQRGRECGSGEVIESVHALLGIDRICAAIKEAKS